KGDVFDVPSSGDEAEPTPKPVHKIRQAAITRIDPKPKPKPKPKHTEKASTDTAEDLGSRKRMKMTPEPEPLLKRLPANAVIRPPKPRPSVFPRKNRQTSPASGQFIKVVPSRPKPMPPSPKRLEVPSTPKKLSPAPPRELSTLSTPSPHLSDIDMMDVDPTGNTISPRGMKLWQGLLERGRRGSIPTLKPLASFHEEEDEDSTIGAVRNVHELRKAGANNRFLDEVQDYLDRIGRPDSTKLSMRRSGLLDLASKMKDKEFAGKFRANGMEMKLFMHLGLEQDVVSGYLMVSLLITTLMDGSIPHVIAQLRRQGITRLLIRLLDCPSSIAAVTRDRKTNMSKVAQSLVAEHHDYLLKIPVWDELQPQLISPRTLALKCIERMVRQTREAGNASDIFSKELTTNLFGLLQSGSQLEWWNLPKDRQAIDFYLALSALESHSITARTVHDESIWISDYLPIIADTLVIALSRPLDTFGQQQALILRLTLNVTNNNPKASDVFARPALMSVIGRTLVAKFQQISRFLTEDDFTVVIEHLVLCLGMMINLADRSSAVRESLQSLEGDVSDPLDSMVQTFLENQERMSMAESVEESQKNVAFGYLSVLLGYFSLDPAIEKRIKEKQARKTLRPIVASIKEFIGHHKTVDDLIAADEDGHNPQAGLTERLESLVSKLESLSF
ncbi:wings apart-like protein regulation of heterochromatin-domain-containing protein, partial [Hyaloscypha finlandica]